MSRFLLDTNILSYVRLAVPSASLMAWMAAQRDEALFISALTLAEIKRGILEKPACQRRNELERWFAGPDGPQALFAGRILAFDRHAALRWAALMAEGKTIGRPRNALDMMIAAAAQAGGCVVVTANEKDFWGIEYINPLAA